MGLGEQAREAAHRAHQGARQVRQRARAADPRAQGGRDRGGGDPEEDPQDGGAGRRVHVLPGHTRSMGNFVTATFLAIKNTYHYLTPDLWTPTHFRKAPNQEFTDFLEAPEHGRAQAPRRPSGLLESPLLGAAPPLLPRAATAQGETEGGQPHVIGDFI